MEDRQPHAAREILVKRRVIYATKPLEDDAVMLCVKAWHDLAADRPVLEMAGAVGSIPFTAITAWAQEHGLDRASRTLLREVLGHVERDRIRRENAERRLNRATGGK